MVILFKQTVFFREKLTSDFWNDHFFRLLNAILKPSIMGKFDSVRYSNILIKMK